MVKHNNQVPNGHFKKDWKRRVKTWFDQPKKKQRRRRKRAEKAHMIAPRPVAGLLRPIVQCPSRRYNMKQREGKGFTFEELKRAGINKHEARGIGIAVDHRRRNTNEEHLQRNVERLKQYKSKLVIFPRNAAKPKKGDSTAEETKNATQLSTRRVLRFPRNPDTNPLREDEARKIKPEEWLHKNRVFITLRRARIDARLEGKRKVRLARKQERIEMEKKLAASGKKKGGKKKKGSK